MTYIELAVAQSIGVIVLALIGAYLGFRLFQIKQDWSILGYGALFALPAIIALTVWVPQLQMFVPFKWVVANRTEFTIMALACPMLMTALIFHLNQKRKKVWVGMFTGIFIFQFSVLPFLVPAFTYARQSQHVTQLDWDGICMQSSSYNCGPAAAVTALRRIGVPAEESTLALAAYTNQIKGTPIDSLSAAVFKEYGIVCKVTYAANLEDMIGKEPFVAQLKFTQSSDHYVTVLKIDEASVTVGDPLTGLKVVTPEQFNAEWRKTAIIFQPTSI